MSIAKIVLTAGLLALQAALLALLHSGEARSATVYQCNGQYQQIACSGAGNHRTMQVADARHAAQVQHATQQLRLMQRQPKASRSTSANARNSRNRIHTGAQQAVGLTAHRHGDAPFRNGRQVGVGSVLQNRACVQIGGSRVRHGHDTGQGCQRLPRHR